MEAKMKRKNLSRDESCDVKYECDANYALK